MWKKIVMVNGDGDRGRTASRLPDEIFEGDFEHAKTLLALQRFDNVREMYIQNMDPDYDSDPVDVYRVISDRRGKVNFIPWSFDIVKLADCFPNPQDQASIQLAAMCQRTEKEATAIKELAKVIESV